jgi:hypothetical protein
METREMTKEESEILLKNWSHRKGRKGLLEVYDTIDTWLTEGKVKEIGSLLSYALPENLSDNLALALLASSRPRKAEFSKQYGDYFERLYSVFEDRHGSEFANEVLRNLR